MLAKYYNWYDKLLKLINQAELFTKTTTVYDNYPELRTGKFS